MTRIALAVCSFVVVGLLAVHARAQEAPTNVGVSLDDVPSTIDPRELPDLRRPDPEIAGKFEHIESVLVMPIYDSRPDATLYYPCRKGRFYIALDEENNRERYYGPIDGDPFQRLNLEASMRTRLRLADEDSNDALLRLRQIIARGDDKLRALSFSMVKELPVPKDRHLFKDLDERLAEALPEISDAAVRRSGEEARDYVARQTATAVEEWNARRVLLPDEEYQAGHEGDVPGEIQWGQVDATSGLQVGFGLANSSEDDPADLSEVAWAFGDKKILTVWVRQQGDQTTKFTSTDQADEGLDMWFVENEGQKNTREPLGFASGAITPKRYRLSQGQWIKLKWCRMSAKELEPGAEKRPYWGRSLAPGEYALHVELRIAAFESQNASGAVTVPAQGEWTGTLTATGGKVHVGAAGE
jgi:hypothetical protein